MSSWRTGNVLIPSERAMIGRTPTKALSCLRENIKPTHRVKMRSGSVISIYRTITPDSCGKLLKSSVEKSTIRLASHSPHI